MRDNCGWLPIHDLCCNQIDLDEDISLEILQFMLDVDSSLPRERVEGEEHYLPIHYAVEGMSTSFCKVLLYAYPASIGIVSDNGSMPIHEACSNGERHDTVDTIQHLLDLYPEIISARDEDDWLPIHCAAMNESKRRTDIVKLLLKYDPDAASKRTESKKRKPLHIASENGHLGATKVLYDAYHKPSFIVIKTGRHQLHLQKEVV